MERIGLAPGSEVGGYSIVAPLGSGGMGAVYRAVDGGGSEVALKLLHPHIGVDPAARERLRREVAALQRLRHPAVAAVLDAEADSTEAFIVTELVDGENLTDHVRAAGPLPDLAVLATGLRDALAAVHDAGVIHRDLKPSNVILTSAGPVLIDFGIAQGVDDARLTSTGIVLGTPGYLAPELLDGAEPDEASDWWGWAAVLAFAATGREPFGSRPVEAVLARARAGEVDLEGVDTVVAAALRAALSPDPSRRAQPSDVLAALRGEAPAWADAGPTVVLPGPANPPAPAQASPGVGPTTPLPGPAPFAPGAGDAAAEAPANDGHTRAWSRTDGGPGSGDRAGEGPQTQAFGADEPGSEHDVDPDADFDDQSYSEPHEAYIAPVPTKRPATILFLSLLAVAAAPLAPGVVLMCVGAATLLFGAVQSDAAALEARRERRGPRRGDGLRAAAASPWHLVRGAAIALPSLLVAASVVVVVGGIAWWLLDTGRIVIPPGGDNDPWVYHAVIALAVLAGLATLWAGPLSRATRLGARRTFNRLAPGRTGALIVIALALVGIAIAVVLLLTGEPTWWWPLPGPPSLA